MKVYKTTLIISVIIFLLLAITSTVLNFFNLPNRNWISFYINWSVGIGCSTVVVIVTTLIQYKIEQDRLLNKCADCLRVLFFHNSFFGSLFNDDCIRNDYTANVLDKIENNWRKSIETDNEKLIEYLNQLEFISKSNQKVLSEILKISYRLQISSIAKEECSNERIEEILKREYEKITGDIILMSEKLLKFKISKFNKDELTKFINQIKQSESR
jgi:hypothetical protein